MKSKIFAALLLSMVWGVAWAEVFPISLNSESQSVSLDTPVKLTVSSATKLSETGDLTLVSSSATGQFSSNSSSWEPVTKLTMNTNSANRNFYYRDSASGTYSLTVTLTGRISGKSYQATQTITVGEGGDDPGYLEDDDSDNSSSDDIVSSHSGSKELTAREKKEALEIGAGRKRLATVGAPVAFEAALNKEVGQTKFEWSFGDGGKVRGRKATHRYLFPGLYNVVLNGRLGEEEAIARTQVEVVEPELEISLIDGAIKISNPTGREVNLGGWGLVSGDQSFVIPSDTLLDPNGATIIPAEISHLKMTDGDKIVLHNPSGRVSALDESRAAKILALETQLMQARAELNKLKPRVVNQGSVLQSNQLKSVVVADYVASSTVIELPRKKSWWAKLVNEISR